MRTVRPLCIGDTVRASSKGSEHRNKIDVVESFTDTRHSARGVTAQRSKQFTQAFRCVEDKKNSVSDTRNPLSSIEFAKPETSKVDFKRVKCPSLVTHVHART